jgi:hypothetical protein
MTRTLWFVAGAGVGIYAITRARRAAEVLTPEGLADRLAGLAVGARLFSAEVRAGAAEKENEVRQRVGLGFAELSAGSGTATAEAPDSSQGEGS